MKEGKRVYFASESHLAYELSYDYWHKLGNWCADKAASGHRRADTLRSMAKTCERRALYYLGISR